MGAGLGLYRQPRLLPPHTRKAQGLLGYWGEVCMAVLFPLPVQVTMRCQSSSTRSTSPIALSWCLWLLRLVTPAALLFLVFR